MARSHEDELQKMKYRQAKEALEALRASTARDIIDTNQTGWQQNNGMQSQSALSSNYYIGGAGGINVSSAGGNIGGNIGRRMKITVGPFTEAQYRMMITKVNSNNLVWEKRLDSTKVQVEFWLMAEGPYDESLTVRSEKQLGDYQIGYDKGYEDGIKRA